MRRASGQYDAGLRHAFGFVCLNLSILAVLFGTHSGKLMELAAEVCGIGISQRCRNGGDGLTGK